jgi:hypothetical protein
VDIVELYYLINLNQFFSKIVQKIVVNNRTMNILNTFRSLRKMRTKRRKGGAGDNECDICFEDKKKFENLNCTRCSDKGINICEECVGIIKIKEENCPMCRGKISHKFDYLPKKIAARRRLKEMQQSASSPRRQASPSRIAASPSRIAASPSRIAASPSRRPVSPSRIAASPSRIAASPSRRPASSSRIAASSSRRPVSPSRIAASSSRRPASSSRRDSPNTIRDNRTREKRDENLVFLARTNASAASRAAVRSRRINQI